MELTNTLIWKNKNTVNSLLGELESNLLRIDDGLAYDSGHINRLQMPVSAFAYSKYGVYHIMELPPEWKYIYVEWTHK